MAAQGNRRACGPPSAPDGGEGGGVPGSTGDGPGPGEGASSMRGTRRVRVLLHPGTHPRRRNRLHPGPTRVRGPLPSGAPTRSRATPPSGRPQGTGDASRSADPPGRGLLHWARPPPPPPGSPGARRRASPSAPEATDSHRRPRPEGKARPPSARSLTGPRCVLTVVAMVPRRPAPRPTGADVPATLRRSLRRRRLSPARPQPPPQSADGHPAPCRALRRRRAAPPLPAPRTHARTHARAVPVDACAVPPRRGRARWLRSPGGRTRRSGGRCAC